MNLRTGILFQAKPDLGVLTDAYVVPTGIGASINSIIITNLEDAQSTFRISIAVNGAADELKQYIFYDVLICSNESMSVAIGTFLQSGDLLRLFSSSGNISFNILGAETKVYKYDK